MISASNNFFHLQTNNSSYILGLLSSGHPTQLYYGRRISPPGNYGDMIRHFEFMPGAETAYSSDYPGVNLETSMLEFPGGGKGDYRSPAIEIRRKNGDRVGDFIYDSHEIIDDILPPIAPLPGTRPRVNPLPSAGTGDATLIIRLRDRSGNPAIELIYRVLESCDIITRQVRVVAETEGISLERIMSTSLDLPPDDYRWYSLPGKWIAEKQLQWGEVPFGQLHFGSRRMSSGAEHNPFVALSRPGCNEESGDCWGFSLVYSGNHQILVEKNSHQLVRVQLGIAEDDFSWNLNPGEIFASPEAIMSFSHRGFSGMSANFHRYIGDYLIHPAWRGKPRPILFNSWEAMYFDFNEAKLMKLAKAGADLGMELFVLDDGWFVGRNDDTSSLGDWRADTDKLPGGLESLSAKVRKLGLEFGIWVEPEMVSPDSDLYRSHPEWAITVPGRKASLGRNQLILDLTNSEVIDHLEQTLNELFQTCRPAYVKWDMNRAVSDHFSAALEAASQGELAHRYILGLYELLGRLTRAWPEILFESCASGGSRFDCGMLYFMPQTWTSDNTDPGSRVRIQHGSSWLYPQHCAGSHVGSDPSHQVLRSNDLETRFHVAAIGALGYELNLTKLSPFEKKVIAKQVALYKAHRTLFQFGSWLRLASPFESNLAIWQVMDPDGQQGMLLYFQQIQHPAAVYETIRLRDLDPDASYEIETLPHYMNIARFGELINDYVPFEVQSSGIRGLAHKVISDNYLFPGEMQKVKAGGDELMYAGFRPYNQFTGTGFNERVRIMGDFSSRLYLIRRLSGRS